MTDSGDECAHSTAELAPGKKAYFVVPSHMSTEAAATLVTWLEELAEHITERTLGPEAMAKLKEAEEDDVDEETFEIELELAGERCCYLVGPDDIKPGEIASLREELAVLLKGSALEEILMGNEPPSVLN